MSAVIERVPTIVRRERTPRPGERVLAAVAHLGIAFGFVGIGFLLGVAISAVIWLVGKRSSYVEMHAEQAGLYQLAVLLSNVVVGAGILVAAILTLGQALGIAGLFGLPTWQADGRMDVLAAVGLLLAAALYVLWFVGTILLGMYGAVRALSGRPFWYPLIGPWVRRRLDGPRH